MNSTRTSFTTLLLVACACAGAVITTAPAQQPLPAPVELPPAIQDTNNLAPAPGQSADAVPVPSIPVKPKITTSTSLSKQFVVHGPDLSLRSAFGTLGDDTSAALSRLLKDPGKFRLPVVVVLKTPPDVTLLGPAVTTSIRQLTHGGFHLQMDVQVRPDFHRDDFTTELLRVLLAERILRDHQELNTTRQRVLPDWVLTGVNEALKFRSRSRPSMLFSAVFRSGQVYSIDKILSADPYQLDALSKGIYEVSSCALVLALLDQTDGPARFSKFLSALATDDKPDRELLRQHFPSLGASKNSLEKWWTLQMAALSSPSAVETLTITDTERELEQAIQLEYTDTPAPAAAPKPSSRPSPKPAAKPKDEPAAEPAEEKKGFFNFDIFRRSKKVFFPFTKKKNPENDEAPTAALKDADKPKEKEKDKPKDSPTPAPKTEPKPKPTPTAEQPDTEASPTPSLKRKPSSMRGISDKPDALPEASAPAATAKPKEKEKEKEADKDKDAEEEDAAPGDKKHGWINPLNWFRKDSEDAPAPDEDAPPSPNSSDTKPAPRKLPTPRASPPQSEAPDHDPVPGSLPGSRFDSTPTPSPATTPLPNTTRLPLENYAEIAKRRDRTAILKRSLDRLAHLKLRAHPLYRDIVSGYAEVVQTLLQGKDKGVTEKLATLRQQTVAVHERAKAVENYVDWYEANHSSGYSGTFDDFLGVTKKLSSEVKPRGDALSRYLDAIEKEYSDTPEAEAMDGLQIPGIGQP